MTLPLKVGCYPTTFLVYRRDASKHPVEKIFLVVISEKHNRVSKRVVSGQIAFDLLTYSGSLMRMKVSVQRVTPFIKCGENLKFVPAVTEAAEFLNHLSNLFVNVTHRARH